jgi:hypothetical protein
MTHAVRCIHSRSDKAWRKRRDDHALYSRISWRLMPILLAAYVVAFLDRSTSATRNCR